MAFLRLIVFGFLALSVVYLAVSFYSRSVRREKLEGRADERIAEGRLEESARDAFIEDGMRDYEHSLRKKLILGVYVVPVIVVIILVYVTNFM